MKWRSGNGGTVDEADLEQIRGLYAALGLGFPPEALRVFGDGDATASDEWCAGYRGSTSRCLKATEFSSRELFTLPPAWDVMRIVVRNVRGERVKRGDVVSVTGHVYCRPRGSWATDRFPFLHVWTMCAGKVLRFESYFDGLELRRMGRIEGCAAA